MKVVHPGQGAAGLSKRRADEWRKRYRADGAIAPSPTAVRPPRDTATSR
jgi:hypothetical protein